MNSQIQKNSIGLAALLEGFVDKQAIDEKFEDIIINGLRLDSRLIKEGYLFLAIKGDSVNGMDFINSAIEKGAVAVLWDANAEVDAIRLNWRNNNSGKEIPIIAVDNLQQVYGDIASRFYNEPSKHIPVCGVTGTNGKTSCADFIAQMMSVETSCGLMGTLGKGVYPDLTETGYTTPDAITCQNWLADIYAVSAKFAVMEVSSHALIQGRVNGIAFNSAVFTNLTRDHLDFHGDMQSYAEAKTKLFKMPGLKNAIINSDDEAGRAIIASLDKNIHCVSYGLNKAYSPDVLGANVKLDQHGLSMQVTTPWGDGCIEAPVIGEFNASNLLAVLSVMLVQGIPFNESLQRLKSIKSVAGRMQKFGGDSSPLVIVDFAHTPDALEQALTSLRQHTQNNLWCVFGCGGDRDKGKRALMGRIAEEKADFIVLTNDNPRTEKPELIIKDIQSGIHNEDNVTIEQDRQAAIHFAIKQAKAGDVVLVAGKGHENYQLIGNKKYPFDDAEEVQHQLEACAG